MSTLIQVKHALRSRFGVFADESINIPSGAVSLHISEYDLCEMRDSTKWAAFDEYLNQFQTDSTDKGLLILMEEQA